MQPRAGVLSRKAPKARFLGSLIEGWLLSTGWFLMHFIITRQVGRDSAVINDAGRLRYLTQQIGMTYLTGQLADARADTTGRPPLNFDLHDTFAQIQAIKTRLLGFQGADGTDGPVGSKIDENVRVTLDRWLEQHYNKLHEMVTQQHGTLTSPHVATVIEEVHLATQEMDNIVDRLSENSEGRARVLTGITAARAITGFIWAVCVCTAFFRIWGEYVSTYHHLQESEQKLDSLLRSAFDVVVPVSGVPPFAVLDQKEVLGTFLGRPLVTGSILDCTCNDDEFDALLDNLETVLGHGQGHRPPDARAEDRGGSGPLVGCLPRWLSSRCPARWWPRAPLTRLPVAQMIPSRWWAAALPGELDQPIQDVEIVMVRGDGVHAAGGAERREGSGSGAAAPTASGGPAHPGSGVPDC